MNIHNRTYSLEKILLKSSSDPNISIFRKPKSISYPNKSVFISKPIVRTLDKLQHVSTNTDVSSSQIYDKLSNSRSTITMTDLPTTYYKKPTFYHHKTIHSLNQFQYLHSQNSYSSSPYQTRNSIAQLRFGVNSLSLLKILSTFRHRVKNFLDNHREQNTIHASHHSKINLNISSVCEIKDSMKKNIISNRFNYQQKCKNFLKNKDDNDLNVEVYIKQESGFEIQTETRFSNLQKGLWNKLHPFLSDNNIDYDQRMKIALQQFSIMINKMQTLSFTVKLPKNLKNEVSDYNDYFQVIKEKQRLDTQMSSIIDEIILQLDNPLDVSVYEKRQISTISDEVIQSQQESIILQTDVNEEKIEEKLEEQEIQEDTFTDDWQPRKVRKSQMKFKTQKIDSVRRFISHDIHLAQEQPRRQTVIARRQEEIKENLIEINEDFIRPQLPDQEQESSETQIQNQENLQVQQLQTQQNDQRARNVPIMRQTVANIVRIQGLVGHIQKTIYGQVIQEEAKIESPSQPGSPGLIARNMVENNIQKREANYLYQNEEQVQIQNLAQQQFDQTQERIEQLEAEIQLSQNKIQKKNPYKEYVKELNSSDGFNELNQYKYLKKQEAEFTDAPGKTFEESQLNEIIGTQQEVIKQEINWLDRLLNADNVYDTNIDKYKLNIYKDIDQIKHLFEDPTQQSIYQQMIIWKNELNATIAILEFNHLKIKIEDEIIIIDETKQKAKQQSNEESFE